MPKKVGGTLVKRIGSYRKIYSAATKTTILVVALLGLMLSDAATQDGEEGGMSSAEIDCLVDAVEGLDSDRQECDNDFQRCDSFLPSNFCGRVLERCNIAAALDFIVDRQECRAR
jgi:hypothetical protein